MSWTVRSALSWALAAALVAPAAAMDPQESVRSALAGGWRFEPDGKVPPACDQAPGENGRVASFEFAITGGLLRITQGDDADAVTGLMLGESDPAKHIAMTTADGESAIAFTVQSPGLMKADQAEGAASPLQGMTLRKCYDAVDRTKIKVEHDMPIGLPDDMAYLSQGGAGEQPRFVDMRFNADPKKLCAEPVSQYVFFDLIGPLGLTMGRWNSGALAEMLAADEKPKTTPDDVANWTIEAVEPIEGGWKITATELIPPNGSRGDTATVSLLAKGDTVEIPEWKRRFLRCTTGEETTVVE